MKSELLIGKALRPRGLKGELKLEIYSSDPHMFSGFSGSVMIAGEIMRVQKFTQEGAYGYVLLEGVDSVEKAEKLRDCEVFVKREDMPALKRGEHFIADIIGLDVKVGGEIIGSVVDVEQYGSADVYSVRTPSGTLSFPALKQLIKDVDIEGGVMTLDGDIFPRVVVRN